MKIYIVFLIQWIIWSAFTLVEWLSRYDKLIFKICMFLVFIHISLFIGKSILKSSFKTIVVTIISLLAYEICHIVFQGIRYAL